MKNSILNSPFEIAVENAEKRLHNPLLKGIRRVISRIAGFKERARAFYFEVILSPHQCPKCGGRLHMTGQSECSCSCGSVFDPTLNFQKSTCCGATLVKKTFHYACSRCQGTVPSRFLFDERVFDKTYFSEMMRESRSRGKMKREEIKRLLAESRSGALPLLEDPHIDSIPGLIQDLNDFIQTDTIDISHLPFDKKSEFQMEHYRDHILSVLGWNSILFSNIFPLIEDGRQDRIRRFITLVFMDNEREVELSQDGSDLWVQKVYNEAYSKG